MVTAVAASARPTKLDEPPVRPMPEPARMFPWKLEPSPTVAVVPVSQNTLAGLPATGHHHAGGSGRYASPDLEDPDAV